MCFVHEELGNPAVARWRILRSTPYFVKKGREVCWLLSTRADFAAQRVALAHSEIYQENRKEIRSTHAPRREGLRGMR